MRIHARLAMVLLLIGLGAAAPGGAEVVRFTLTAPAEPAFAGQVFGDVGRYERLTAQATLALDPADPRHAGIVDLALAPRTAAGRVEAVSEVVILRPVDPLRGNGTLLVEVPNRGREVVGQLYNDVVAANGLLQGRDAGNGFLLRRGYTLVWVGWQADLPPGGGLRLEAPVLSGVTGPSREEFVFDHATNPATARLTYPVAAEDAAVRASGGGAAPRAFGENAAPHASGGGAAERAFGETAAERALGATAAARAFGETATPRAFGGTLTVRAQADEPRQTPADLRLRLLDAQRIEIARPAGFDAGAIYEFIYTARDPTVQGIAFAAVRDVADFLRRSGDAGTPPGGAVDRAVLAGVSQSGRFVRDFLHQGFNEGAQGRPVFEAMLPHIAGTRRTFTNARFAQPGRNPAPHGDRHYPADQFPFAYAETEDHLTGQRDGLLLRCRRSGTCPRVMQTDSEYEFWGARASLLVTDTRGGALALPPEVRAYAFAGHPHFAAAGSVAERSERCALPVNPNHAGAPMRALLVAMEAWMRLGVAPPPSRYPTVGDGTLAPAAGLYPPIPGLGYRGVHGPAQRVDASVLPPAVRGEYAVLLPRVDADGNALGGVRTPAVAVPRATYTGWNPRAVGYAPGALCTNTGGVVPFAATRAERVAAGDPRLSIEERYATAAAYEAAVAEAAERLAAGGLLLAEDVAAIRAAAGRDALAGLRR